MDGLSRLMIHCGIIWMAAFGLCDMLGRPEPAWTGFPALSWEQNQEPATPLLADPLVKDGLLIDPLMLRLACLMQGASAPPSQHSEICRDFVDGYRQFVSIAPRWRDLWRDSTRRSRHFPVLSAYEKCDESVTRAGG